MDKNDSSEAELIFRVQKGNTLDFAKLLDRYKRYSYALSDKYYNTVNTGGVTKEELYTVCIESLMVAIKNFKGTGHMFYSYWKEVALRDMLKYLEKNSYLMGAKAFAGLSIDNLNESEYLSVSNVIGEDDGEIYSQITYKEMSQELFRKRIITSTEHKILNMLILGYDVESIAKRMRCSKSKIYSKRNILRKKISQRYGLNKQPK